MQPVLIIIYFDAGLKQLANVSGHKGETLKALSSCSHFTNYHGKYHRYYSEYNINLFDAHFRVFYNLTSDMTSHDPNWHFWQNLYFQIAVATFHCLLP